MFFRRKRKLKINFFFYYLGAINITVDNVQELMVAADMLHLNEVVSICGEFLKSHMDSSNCVGIFQFSEQIGCLEMLEFTENYIYVHFLEVCMQKHLVLSSTVDKK